MVDGTRVDSFFSSENLNNRFKPKLESILNAELVIPKQHVSTQTEDNDFQNISKKKKKN